MAQHSNFVGNQTLDVGVVEFMAGATVCLTQYAGSMHFQFAMTPEKARALAADLVDMAAKVEQMVASRAAA